MPDEDELGIGVMNVWIRRDMRMNWCKTCFLKPIPHCKSVQNLANL